MITLNNKIGITDKLVAIKCEHTHKEEYILEEVINNIILSDTELNLSCDRILSITDKCDNKIIELKNGKTVKSMSYLDFSSEDILTDAMVKDLQSNHQVIFIGKINCIDRTTFFNILLMFNTSLIFVYGDQMLDSPERGNFHNRILANSSITIKSDYEGKNTDKKKVSLFLNRLRNKDADIKSINGSNYVDIVEENSIDENTIERFLKEDEDSLVIIPRAFNQYINTALDTANGLIYAHDLKHRNIFYTKLPFITVQVNPNTLEKEILKLAPMTKVYIETISEIDYEKDSQVLVKLYVPDAEGKIEWDKSYTVPLYIPDYINNFETMFDRTSDEKYVPDSLLKLTPYKITTPEYSKYTEANRVMGYVQLTDKIKVVYAPNSHYDTFCSAKEEVVCIHSDEFDNSFLDY